MHHFFSLIKRGSQLHWLILVRVPTVSGQIALVRWWFMWHFGTTAFHKVLVTKPSAYMLWDSDTWGSKLSGPVPVSLFSNISSCVDGWTNSSPLSSSFLCSGYCASTGTSIWSMRHFHKHPLESCMTMDSGLNCWTIVAGIQWSNYASHKQKWTTWNECWWLCSSCCCVVALPAQTVVSWSGHSKASFVWSEQPKSTQGSASVLVWGANH